MTAPQCVGGAFGGLDPLVREYWYVHINEGLPIWHQRWRNALVLMAMSACGIVDLLSVQSKAAPGAVKDIRIAGFFLIYVVVAVVSCIPDGGGCRRFLIPLIAVWITSCSSNIASRKSQ